MIVELGHLLLIFAFVLSMAQAVVPGLGAARHDHTLMGTAPPLSVAVFCFTLLSFAALMWAYAVSDFSVVNVWQNSHSQMPFLYKLTGTWGNHEGSMLLWVLIMALFAAAVGVFGSQLPDRLCTLVLAVQGAMTAAFLAFIVFTSNPFLRQAVAPEGRDLNPILQDVGLAIHPPMLYLGYVGFSITFAFAVAALVEGQIDAVWARWVRPWAVAAWMFLTAGIAMGSYWAYYELGWGGWWFWDPVENASFLPWLTGTALLHSALVMEKRDALKIWTVLLAIVTFSLSLLGTFLVRSGVLTSVHTFASDPERGVFILAILVVLIGGSLALFAFRATSLQQGGLFAPISREGALVLNNLFLCTAAATVLIGTLYPMIYEAFTGGQKLSVGAPFFNMTFGPLMIPLILVLPFGPLLAWKRGDLAGVAQRLLALAIVSVVVAAMAAAWQQNGPWMAPLGIGLAAWAILGAFAEIWQRAAFSKSGISVGFRRLAGLPRSVWSTALAHAGVGVTLLGIVAVTAFETEEVALLKRGDSAELNGYRLTFDRVLIQKAGNYNEQGISLSVTRDGEPVAVMTPSKRVYPARQMPTSEAAIETFGFSQLYVAMGEVDPEQQTVTVRIWHKPLITLIWFGAILMSIAGLITLTDRKFRVAVPKRARRQTVAVLHES